MLSHVLERFPNGSVNVFDADLRYLYAAGAGLERVGLSAEAMLGKRLDDFFSPEQVTLVEGPFRRAFAGETVVVDLPLGERIFALSAAPLEIEHGTVRSIVVAAQEVTDRVRAEEERAVQREQQARLEGMLYAAHELASRAGTGLARSSGAIDGLRPESAIPAHLRASLETAAAALADAARAIDELQGLIPIDGDGRVRRSHP
jgi:PAS domain S-box-containing protein